MKKYLLILLLSLSVFTNCYSEEYRVPVRTGDNLIIASYNIKWFGQLKHDTDKLAYIIQSFDICGILEVKDKSAILDLISSLERITNKEWSYVLGMKTTNPNGKYYEIYSFVYRKDRAELGDGIISNIYDQNEVYRNDPFLCSFNSGRFSFILFLVHTRWSSDIDGNVEKEILTIPSYITQLRKDGEKNIILLGDFNKSKDDSSMKTMIKKTKMIQADPNLNTTFKSDYSGYVNSYDHVFISKELTGKDIESSVVDCTRLIYEDNEIANMALSSKELSDHLPVWVIVKVK